MIRQLFYAASFLTVACAASCVRPLYRPEIVHDAMLAKGGEFSGTASVMMLDAAGSPSFDIGLGVAPFEGFGIKASLRNRVKGSSYSNNQGVANGRTSMTGVTAEGGLGYFSTIGAGRVFSIYGNFSYAQNRYRDFDAGSNIIYEYFNAKNLSFSVQPSLLIVKPKVRMALGLRCGFYQYYDIDAPQGSQEYRYRNEEGVFYFIPEPYYNIAVGGGPVKFFGQYGFAFVPSHLTSSGTIFHNKLAIGIHLALGR
jgi:hypothetical protein